MLHPILKYPRTPHLQGSRLQPGDEDHSQVPYSGIVGKWISVEEKIDGANAGISFSNDAELILQSRGHALTGGARERHFNIFKRWAQDHEGVLFDVLTDRYVCYGEWMFGAHSVYYDLLPHYFLEFDVLDRKTGKFISTPRRRELLAEVPVTSVPVLYEGPAPKHLQELLQHIGMSSFKSSRWRATLDEECRRQGLHPARFAANLDPSDLMEGLYIKIETGEETVGRLKWVRQDFVQTILDSGTHWLDRPIVPNRLAPNVDIYAPDPQA